MKVKSEFANAAQLVILLCLLFWSLTWNSSSKMKYNESDTRKYVTQPTSNDRSSAKPDKLRLTYQHYYFIKSLAAVQYTSERYSEVTQQANTILPTFNEWKAMEKQKHEIGSMKQKAASNLRPLSRRKLNFSSSKCGAKILASNPEAKHRTAILNEKVDEYLLNPCRVRTWFVIELCDTVEATQIEFANYELYSSSPKKFYVFWSDVYPAVLWHLLGTFEAKDRRTMQTFDLNVKNLGKFIKVVIYSHHGKEHYCPLSVIRVLGYSMVQDFEDKENENNFREPKLIYGPIGHDDKDSVSNKRSFEVPLENSSSLYKKSHFQDFFTSRRRSLFSHCSDITSLRRKELNGKICVNRPVCRFLNAVTASFSELRKIEKCDKNFHIKKVTDKEITDKNISLVANVTDKAKLNDGLFDDISKLQKFERITNVCENNSSLKSLKNYFSTSNMINKTYYFKSSKDHSYTYINTGNFTNSSNIKKFTNYENSTKVYTEEDLRTKCICNPKEMDRTIRIKSAHNNNKIKPDLKETEDYVDSAGLIHKESVLIRLNSRITYSESELNLINKYLQQLSQSYRQQMESMQALFNQTVTAINIASENSAIIDNKQQESINDLEIKVKSLRWKIEHQITGQKDLIKRVVELHGFFLILEIILISTIFTIFLNILRRRNMIFRERNPYIWKLIT